MKRFMILLAVLTGALQLAHAQPGIGAQYSARDPITCASKKDPARGAPSAQQVILYIRCDASGEGVLSDWLFLFENVTVEIGNPRAFQPDSDINMPGIDTSFPVYPIRGSYQKYQCGHTQGSWVYKPGQNCDLITTPQASGVCYKTSFGDWACRMASVDPVQDLSGKKTGIAGPR